MVYGVSASTHLDASDTHVLSIGRLHPVQRSVHYSDILIRIAFSIRLDLLILPERLDGLIQSCQQTLSDRDRARAPRWFRSRTRKAHHDTWGSRLSQSLSSWVIIGHISMNVLIAGWCSRFTIAVGIAVAVVDKGTVDR